MTTQGAAALWPFGLLLLAFLAAAFTPMLRRSSPPPSPEAGRVGERRVRGLTTRHGLEALHDVYLRTRTGATQIDHLVRSGRTIFVLETKHFAGACFGRPQDRSWTQVRNGARRQLYNPLLQNARHAETVRLVAGGWCRISPLVVFTGSAIFPKGVPEGVVDLDGLDDILGREARRRPRSLIGWLAWRRLNRSAETVGTAGAAHRRSLARARAR